MKKNRKIILGLASLSLVVPLASCGSDISGGSANPTANYEVVLAKPMIVSSGDASWSWAPVEGASGYVAKIDDGKEFGIGSTTITSNDSKLCYYVQNTDDLTEGKHTIKFAAYKNGNVLSDWTDAYTFYVSNKVNRPQLSSNLVVSANNYIESVTYDFGNNITKTVKVSTATKTYYPSIDDLDLDSALEDGKTYVVTCKITSNGVSSESSNPITCTYSKSKYNAINKPTINAEKNFVFDSELENPVVTLKVNNKEYVTELKANSNTISYKTVLEKLVSDKQLQEDDLLDKDELKISLRVSFDNKHYIQSEYSDEISVSLSELGYNDLEIFEDLCNNLNTTFNTTDKVLSVGYNSEYVGYTKLSVKACNEKGEYLSVTKKTIDYKEIATIDYKDAKKLVLTLTYTRNNHIESKEITIEVPQKTKSLVYNVVPSSDYFIWSKTGDCDYFEVDVTSNGVTKTYKTLSNRLDYSKIDVDGEISVTVYAAKDGNRDLDSKSNSITVRRSTPVTSLYVKDGYVNLSENMKLTLVDQNGQKYTHSYSEYGTNQYSISGIKEIRATMQGDSYTLINSKETTFAINSITTLKYEILDSKYLVLSDYKDPRNLVSSSYSKYFEYDETLEKYKFNVAESQLSSLRFSGMSSEYLKLSSDNEVIDFTIDFKYAPSVSITTNSSNDVSIIYYEPVSKYYGNYDIYIKKYNEENQEYEAFIDTRVADMYYDLRNLEEGKYQVSIRTSGNGYVCAGAYTTITYYANTSNIIEDVNYLVSDNHSSSYTYSSAYTRIDLVQNGLTYTSKLNGYSSSSVYYNYIDLKNSGYTSLSITASNSQANVYYKVIPYKTYSLSEVSINSPHSYSFYVYNVDTYKANPYKCIMDNVLCGYYTNNSGKLCYQSTSGEVSGKVNYKFRTINVENVKSTTLDVSKYVGRLPYNKYNTSISQVVVDESKNLYDYLNSITAFSSDKYVWKYQKVTSDGETEDTRWYDLTSDVNIDSVKKLRIDESYVEYLEDGLNSESVKYTLYKDSTLKVTYTETYDYPSGLTGKYNVYGDDYTWNYVDEQNGIICIKNLTTHEDRYYVLKEDFTISLYVPEIPSSANTYTINEYLLQEDSSSLNLSEEEIEKLNQVKFVTFDDYVIRYVGDEVCEVFSVDKIDTSTEYLDSYEFSLTYYIYDEDYKRNVSKTVRVWILPTSYDSDYNKIENTWSIK